MVLYSDASAKMNEVVFESKTGNFVSRGGNIERLFTEQIDFEKRQHLSRTDSGRTCFLANLLAEIFEILIFGVSEFVWTLKTKRFLGARQ